MKIFHFKAAGTRDAEFNSRASQQSSSIGNPIACARTRLVTTSCLPWSNDGLFLDSLYDECLQAAPRVFSDWRVYMELLLAFSLGSIIFVVAPLTLRCVQLEKLSYDSLLWRRLEERLPHRSFTMRVGTVLFPYLLFHAPLRISRFINNSRVRYMNVLCLIKRQFVIMLIMAALRELRS